MPTLYICNGSWKNCPKKNSRANRTENWVHVGNYHERQERGRVVEASPCARLRHQGLFPLGPRTGNHNWPNSPTCFRGGGTTFPRTCLAAAFTKRLKTSLIFI